MGLDPAQSAPGNRVKFNGQESDVTDRIVGESGNRYLLLANPDDANAGLRVINESYVIEHADSEHVSTTAAAKDPEVAAAAAEAESKEEELAEFRAWKAEQDASPGIPGALAPDTTNNPTVPTGPTV